MIITTRENPSENKVLILGLLPQEQEWLEMVSRECDFQLELAQDEINLARRAELHSYDLFILNQTDKYINLFHMAWLFKNMCLQSHIVLIYTVTPEDKIFQYDLIPDATVITRPYDAKLLYESIRTALQNRDPICRDQSFFSNGTREICFPKNSCN